jgi:AraC family transcriptional regulator of adaptative response / DNA-3-methyladenine glycosylase II
MLVTELGAGPIALARAQRAQTARVLIETTSLGLAEVAFAAGFGSVRQFNDTVREIYGRAPGQLRRTTGRAEGPEERAAGTLTLRLPYRSPLHADSLLDFLGARAIPGVEERVEGTYRRTLTLPYGAATAALTPGPRAARLHRRRTHARRRARPGADGHPLPPALRPRRRPAAVDEVLAADPALAESVRKEPGVRVPGAVDGFEIAVRAVVGQQVSVPAARKVLGKLVTAAGRAGFPDAAALLALPDEAFAMPAARRATLRGLATAVVEGLRLDGGSDRAEARAALLELPGIGPWTADYIALRALGDPDVFLPTDLGIRRGAAALGLPDDPKKLAAHAERWRPWRSYATIRLWRHA